MNPPSPTADHKRAGVDRNPAADEQSLARGVIYRFIAAAYRYPQPGTLDDVRRQNRAVSEAFAALGDSSHIRLPAHFAGLQSMAEETPAADLQRDYLSLFGHVVRGHCPLYEVEYGESDERLQQPHELSDLSAFYRAFGLKLGTGIQERVDFIAVECEFMAFLCVKQAYAEEHGDATLAGLTLDAQRKFLHVHLGRWLPACARRIAGEAGDSFYRQLARVTLAYVTDDCRRLDVTPGKEHLKLRLPLNEADACLSCPMAEGDAEADAPQGFPPKD